MKRRHFLRAAAATVALPALPSLLPRAAWANDPDDVPFRLLVWFVPNGIVMKDWTPSNQGKGYQLPTILSPLALVQDHVSVITGLANRAAIVSQPGDHARGTGSFLTCETVQFTSGSDIQNGTSVDQVLAQSYGSATPFPSLELGMEGGGSTGSCDSGYPCAYQRNISWASPTTPMPKITNVRTAFNRLFAEYDATLSAEELQRRKSLRLSVLDFVVEDIQQLDRKLGQRDRQKLDEYLTAVRQLETRIDGSSELVCVPGEPPASGLDYETSVDLMNELMVLALQCDVTRIATFMLGNGGSNKVFDFLGVSGAHHKISHHDNDAQNLADLTTINRWEVSRFADLVGQLAETKDQTDRPLIESTLAMFSSEIEDGNSHKHKNLPVLLAGQGGGVHDSGRHFTVPPDTPIANLYVSMLQAGGIETDTFGSDGVGPLDQLA